MTPEEFVAIATERYGKRWKMPMAQETGWSYWTLHRVEKGDYEISPKLERAVKALKPRRKK